MSNATLGTRRGGAVLLPRGVRPWAPHSAPALCAWRVLLCQRRSRCAARPGSVLGTIAISMAAGVVAASAHDDPGKAARAPGVHYRRILKGKAVVATWTVKGWRCEHGRRRRECKECGGTSICEHGRRPSLCKECGAPEPYLSVPNHGNRICLASHDGVRRRQPALIGYKCPFLAQIGLSGQNPDYMLTS